jgi:Ca2+-binding RTX toxin-like protein
MMVVTLVCAAITLPAAGALLLFLSPSSVFAQQEETSLGEEGDDFASGIVSNVLDGSGNDDEDNNDSNDEEENGDGSATGDGDTNTQIAVPIITQDQREANLAEQLGLNVDIVEEVEEEVTPTPTPTPEEDTTPPTLTVPGEITVEATSPDGAVVRFEVTAEDNVDGTATLEEDGTTVTQDDVGGDITISCIPRSGSVFPIGRTIVECTATDEAGNTGRASFTVTVNPITCLGVPATIYGTEGNDNLVGTEGRDIIVALGGNDRVQALGGDDAVCGGDGDDTLIGGAGNDVIDGGPNTDTCDAETEFNCET